MPDLTLALLNLSPIHRHTLDWAAKWDKEQPQGLERSSELSGLLDQSFQGSAPGEGGVCSGIYCLFFFLALWFRKVIHCSITGSLGRFCHMHKRKKIKSYSPTYLWKYFPFHIVENILYLHFSGFFPQNKQVSPMWYWSFFWFGTGHFYWYTHRPIQIVPVSRWETVTIPSGLAELG